MLSVVTFKIHLGYEKEATGRPVFNCFLFLLAAGREVKCLEKPNGQSPQQVSSSLCCFGKKVYSFHFPLNFLLFGLPLQFLLPETLNLVDKAIPKVYFFQIDSGLSKMLLFSFSICCLGTKNKICLF